MSMKILKPIKRFWRGLTKRMRTACLLLLCAVLLLGGFGVYLLVRPSDTAEGATQTLFPSVERAQIASVLCHTKSGAEYTVQGAFYTVTDAHGDPQTYKRFYIVTPDGTEEGYAHDALTLNASKLSYFVVGTGKNYVYSPVVSAPASGEEGYAEKLAAYEAKKRELGFSPDSPYYELTTTDGASYRVYYGIKDVTGDGYYVLLAGEETIYSTKNAFVGDLLQETGPESLIDSTVFYPSQNAYAYAYPQKLSLTDFVRVDTHGTVVGADAYSVGYTLIDENGKRLHGDAPLASFEGESEVSRLYREAAAAFFVGRKIGECKETFTFTYPDTEEAGTLRGETVNVYVETVDYVTESTLRFSLKYLPMLDRDLSQKLSVYAYTAPSDITSYIPDSDTLLTALEDLLGMSGTVVKLGLDDDVITEYGLYRHQLWIRYPYGTSFSSDEVDKNAENADSLMEQAFFKDDSNFIEGRIYISDETERGTRYVASLLYDLVIEVDAAVLDFMNKSPVELVDDYTITASILDVKSFRMYWNYGEGKWLSDAYEFLPTIEKVVNVSGQANEEITKLTAIPVGGGEALSLDPESYYQLYTRLAYTHYRGEHGLSEEELSALISDGTKCVLRIDQTLKDNTINFWEFYPVSANRVVVRVKNGSHAQAGARFYIYTTALADIANGYLHMMEGEPYDYEQRYD